MRRVLPTAVLLVSAAVLLAACAGNADYTPILRSEPEADSIQTRMPRTLRLYYNALPDVGRSSLSLTGPGGEVELRGLHTMAADDLMIEIMEPLANGDYSVKWTAAFGDDPTEYVGEVRFRVQIEPQ